MSKAIHTTTNQTDTGLLPVKGNTTHTESPNSSITYTVAKNEENEIRCKCCNSLLGRYEKGTKGVIKIKCGKNQCKHDNILKVA